MGYPTQQEIIKLHNEQYDRVFGKKAGDTYINADGIEYTIFSARKAGTGYNEGKRYSSYTFDLSVENPNGKLDGKPCHWEYITI